MTTAAVVVTYNRLPLLKQCLERILAQSTPCEILVVNNHSCDGTDVYLERMAQEHKNIQYCDTGKNLGGAGGFHYGIKWAAEAGYDYIWIMDDDCLPEKHAHRALLEANKKLQGQYGWLSSQCMWVDGRHCPMNVQRVSPYRDLKTFEKEHELVQMASFVSLFLPRKTIQNFGLPIKEFFIWTDDWEYTRRVSLKMNCYMVRDSVVVHAMKQKTVANIATDSEERLPRYQYFYRNDVVLYRREGIKGWFWLLAKNIWHSIQVLRAGNISRISIIWHGFFEGIRFYPEIEHIACK